MKVCPPRPSEGVRTLLTAPQAEVVDLEAGTDALHVPLPPSLPESRAATPSHISANFSNQTQSLDEKDGSVRAEVDSEKASTQKTVDTERRSVAESNHSARPSQKPAESLYYFQLASPPASVGTRVSTRQGSHVSLAQSHHSNPRTVSPVPTVPEPAEKPPVIQELRHELIDSAPDLDDESESGWAAIAKSINDVDEQKIRDHKEDIDTILVFVSPPRAILLYQSLKASPNDRLVCILRCCLLYSRYLSQLSSQTKRA